MNHAMFPAYLKEVTRALLCNTSSFFFLFFKNRKDVFSYNASWLQVFSNTDAFKQSNCDLLTVTQNKMTI